MTLEPLTRKDMEQIRVWRHEFKETLRTPFMLTKEMQEDYYRDTICNRDSKTRYWALCEHKFGRRLLGYGGIENISWENSNGEMSLLIDPDRHGEGLGSEAVEMFLEQAFSFLNLNVVYGECYGSGPYEFWEKMVEKYEGEGIWLPRRKFWQGEYYDSFGFTFCRGKLAYKGALV